MANINKADSQNQTIAEEQLSTYNKNMDRLREELMNEGASEGYARMAVVTGASENGFYDEKQTVAAYNAVANELTEQYMEKMKPLLKNKADFQKQLDSTKTLREKAKKLEAIGAIEGATQLYQRADKQEAFATQELKKIGKDLNVLNDDFKKDIDSIGKSFERIGAFDKNGRPVDTMKKLEKMGPDSNEFHQEVTRIQSTLDGKSISGTDMDGMEFKKTPNMLGNLVTNSRRAEVGDKREAINQTDITYELTKKLSPHEREALGYTISGGKAVLNAASYARLFSLSSKK